MKRSTHLDEQVFRLFEKAWYENRYWKVSVTGVTQAPDTTLFSLLAGRQTTRSGLGFCRPSPLLFCCFSRQLGKIEKNQFTPMDVPAPPYQLQDQKQHPPPYQPQDQNQHPPPYQPKDQNQHPHQDNPQYQPSYQPHNQYPPQAQVQTLGQTGVSCYAVTQPALVCTVQHQVVQTVNPVVVVQNHLTDVSGQMMCPYCQTTVITRTGYKNGLLTWTICGVLAVLLLMVWSHIQKRCWTVSGLCPHQEHFRSVSVPFVFAFPPNRSRRLSTLQSLAPPSRVWLHPPESGSTLQSLAPPSRVWLHPPESGSTLQNMAPPSRAWVVSRVSSSMRDSPPPSLMFWRFCWVSVC
ncbi:G protein-coupled receptor, class C, group 5, member Bb isoform X2 [Antennarius striatus]|uniref:G protein-coupled receptor, class C, group 5, member Bb isoform X2 n=1 Tax=Antennarius striatus TaxID=241820 RepID=UPI0035B46992